MLALLGIILLVTNGVLSDWTPVEKDLEIPLDLTQNSLIVRTFSLHGRIRWMTGSESTRNVGKMTIFLSSRGRMRYMIEGCTFGRFTVEPAIHSEVLIWKFIKTETSLVVYCNEVEVLNYLFADSTRPYCQLTWDGAENSGLIVFSRKDSASKYYDYESLE